MTGVKEQTAATCGESSGQPLGLEDPHQRVEDNKEAVSYLTTIQAKGIDPDRIGVLGVCASGGYTSYAAQSEVRIKALATVSAACVGRMTRNGGLHRENNQESRPAIDGALQAAAQWRTAEARESRQQAPQIDMDSFFKDAAAYYGSARGRHERSDQRVPPLSYDLMVPYDSFQFQHLISPRPLLMIAGTDAQALHFSEDAIRSARAPKELFTVDGLNHCDLYDNLDVAGPKLVAFFDESL